MTTAFLLGVGLAVATLAYVLFPILGPWARRGRARPVQPSRAVSDEEIEAAVRSYRATRRTAGIACPTCGSRPEYDAVFCSTCGRRLGAANSTP